LRVMYVLKYIQTAHAVASERYDDELSAARRRGGFEKRELLLRSSVATPPYAEVTMRYRLRCTDIADAHIRLTAFLAGRVFYANAVLHHIKARAPRVDVALLHSVRVLIWRCYRVRCLRPVACRHTSANALREAQDMPRRKEVEIAARRVMAQAGEGAPGG